ncbi:MAG: hypothetical protein CL936_19040 [Deltaproteobacteria bacterium]|nr:hypothetical protein [Deltaproteobacteria bacterium]
MTNTLTTIQKIITAPLLAFALMAPMPEEPQSEKLWHHTYASSYGSLSYNFSRSQGSPQF